MKRKQERSAGEYDRQYSLGFGRSVGKHFQRDFGKSLQISFRKSLAAALSAALVLSTISWHGASLQAEASSGEKNGITYESYVSGDREKQKEYTIFHQYRGGADRVCKELQRGQLVRR